MRTGLARGGSARRTASLPGVLLAVLFTLLLAHGCSCGSDPQLTASADVGPKDQSTQVACGCSIELFDTDDCRGGIFRPVPNPLVTILSVCLPSGLNLGQNAGAASLSDLDWKNQVTDYCQNTMADTARKLYAFETKNGCDHQCIKDIKCTLQPNASSSFSTAANPTCGAECDSVACDYNNCGSDAVIAGTKLDIDKCKCTVLPPKPWAGGCGVTTDSEVFCIKPPGNQDPPKLKSGLLTDLLASRIQVELDRNTSSASMTVGFKDFILASHTDTETFKLAGSVVINGVCTAGTPCDAYLEMDLSGADATFNFPGVVCGPACIENVSVRSSSISFVGGMGTTLVHIDSSGMGHIPMNALSYRVEAVIEGVPGESPNRRILESTNDRPIDFMVDLSSKTFAISAAPFTFADGKATLTLAGTVVNQPPIARAGAPQTVECTSPTGGTATLDASGSSDPDNNIAGWEWWTGHALTGGDSAGTGRAAAIIAPFSAPSLATSYELSVYDGRFGTSIDRTSVTVQDTTPPTLDLTLSPQCLWPPNHKMVLFELGKNLVAKVTDRCDPNPDVRIVDVTSNQPSNGGGSGNTNTDVAFGAGGFCVRAERDGSLSSDREYTVTVRARDASGKETKKQVVVRVHHDQGQANCANVDPARYVSDNDPRCSEGL